MFNIKIERISCGLQVAPCDLVYLIIHFVLHVFADLEKLSTFSQRFPLPSMYRIHVWKVLLG